MTLYRQLLLWSFLILTVLCTGLWVFEFKQTKAFLENQLQSHAGDAARSLGLSISSVHGGRDVAVMETMVNALFDSGYYKFIKIDDVEGNRLVNKVSDIQIENIPGWFIHSINLRIPGADALIMDGWQQVGTISIESNPGYAYSLLWQSTTSDLLWFTTTFVFVALLGSYMLQRLLAPLKGIEQQALALTERKFVIQEKIPKTRELRFVTLAMNRATARLQEIFREQTTMADSIIQKLYQDPSTHLGNRRYVEEQIKAKVETGREDLFGAFLIIQIQELQKLNQTVGYQKADILINDLADIARKARDTQPGTILGRLSGADFAMLLPSVDLAQARRFAEEIVSRMNQHLAAKIPNAVFDISCGGAYYGKATNFTQLASRADASLEQSKSEKNSRIHIVDIDNPEKRIVPGKTETSATLEALLQSRNLLFFTQSISAFGRPDQIFHHEILTRFANSTGKILSVGSLVPVAEQSGLMPTLDRIILEELHAHIAPSTAQPKYAINLSPLSVTDAAFMAWLPGYLAKIQDKNMVLNFEFPEIRAIRLEDAIKDFAELVRKAGHAIGIDHFGQGLTNLRYIKSILPHYVKIDRSLTNALKKEGDESFFLISTLCNVAHSLDIKTIIEGIETEEQVQLLETINVDAVQGFLYQRPERLLSTSNNIVNK